MLRRNRQASEASTHRTLCAAAAPCDEVGVMHDRSPSIFLTCFDMSESTPAPEFPQFATAAVFREAGSPLELQEFPLPIPGPGEALVRVECCTICGSDLHTVTGARREPVPAILGHEILGVAAAVGEPALMDMEGRPLAPGDRVTWSVAVACGSCDRCRKGLPQKCRSLAKYGHELAEGRGALSGGLSEYVLLRVGTAAVRVDPEIPAEVICPVNCATATIAAAYRVAGEVQGCSVLILGAGMLGLTATAYAKTQGAASVTVCDLDERRLNLARRFGADHTAPFETDPDQFDRRLQEHARRNRFDIIIELSGAVQAVEAACRVADVGAAVVLVGTVMKSPPARIDPEQVIRRWLTIRGVHNYAPQDLLAAVRFLEHCGGRFPFAELVADRYLLRDVNLALEAAVRDRPIRVAIRP